MALSDPTRQRIVEMLARGAQSSGDIARQFDMSAAAVSQHLRTLREAGLVRVHAEAQRRIYELDPAGLDALAQWVARIRGFWSIKLDALEAQLKQEN